MIRDKRARGLLLAGIIALSVIAGAIAVGPVVAQDGTDATNDTNATNDTAGPIIEYVEGTGGLQARFADAEANTVETIPPRTVNFDIVNTQYSEPYTVTITAAGMNETILEEVVYDNDSALSRFGLTRDDVIGFDFTGVSSGTYEVTASPVEADASVTVPIEITSQNGTDGGTEDGGATDGGTEGGAPSAIGNVTVSAAPASANATANHTLALTAEGDVGTLSGIAVNYTGSNVSLDGVGPGTIVTANVSSNGTNTSIAPNVTNATVAPSGEAVTFNADDGPTIEAGDELVMTYGGADNPPEEGTYNISVTLNGSTAVTATAPLEITANDSMGNGTDTANQTPMGDNATDAANTTETTQETTEEATTQETTEEETTQETTEAGTTEEAMTEMETTGAGMTEETTTQDEPTDEAAAPPEEPADTETETEAAATTESGTPAGGPGFGIAVALVAVLAAALIAARRQ